jgi:erythromycin esterase-like protein
MPDLSLLRRAAHPIRGNSSDYTAILEAAQGAHFVLIGEASHGTREFYAERARITQKLIAEYGFHAVAAEADWPDAYQANRYVRHIGDAATADAALSGFKRFPSWMWRNRVVEEFVAWLHAHNAGLDETQRAGFYGLDLYSLHASIEAVLQYLDRVDPHEAERARRRYACFELFGEDAQAYGYNVMLDPKLSCEDGVVDQLVALLRREPNYIQVDGRVAAEHFFSAEQNARVVKNAEQYYRAMFHGRASTWNLRDQHMCDTLYLLQEHLREQGITEPRIVVWAHNSHLGDATATQMSGWGELNLGQLVRERSGDRAILIGMTTYSGTVTAASDWDAPTQLKRIRPGLPGSYERLFHDVEMPKFWLSLRDTDVAATLEGPLLERAIGVIYRPETERSSHYFLARLDEQFDFVIHLDETHALEPLERGIMWAHNELPETYPSGI